MEDGALVNQGFAWATRRISPSSCRLANGETQGDRVEGIKDGNEERAQIKHYTLQEKSHLQPQDAVLLVITGHLAFCACFLVLSGPGQRSASLMPPPKCTDDYLDLGPGAVKANLTIMTCKCEWQRSFHPPLPSHTHTHTHPTSIHATAIKDLNEPHADH